MASPIINDTITAIRVPKEDEFLAITGITITDSDGGSQSVTLTATHGTITLNPGSGATGISGNGTHTVTFNGTLAQINAALNGMTFLGNLNTSGAASVTLSVQDGLNPAVTKTIDLSISSVNDTPSIAGSTPLTLNEGGTASFAAPTVIGSGLTQSQLGLTDVDNSTTQVIIKLTSLPSSGILKLAGAEIAIGSTFSVSQLSNLTYTHNGNQVIAPAGITDAFNITEIGRAHV